MFHFYLILSVLGLPLQFLVPSRHFQMQGA